MPKSLVEATLLNTRRSQMDKPAVGDTAARAASAVTAAGVGETPAAAKGEALLGKDSG